MFGHVIEVFTPGTILKRIYIPRELKHWVPFYLKSSWISGNEELIEEYVDAYRNDGNFLRDLIHKARQPSCKELSLKECLRFLKATGKKVKVVKL